MKNEKHLARFLRCIYFSFRQSKLYKDYCNATRRCQPIKRLKHGCRLEELNLKYAAGVQAANDQITANNKLIAERAKDKNALNKNTEYQLWWISS